MLNKNNERELCYLVRVDDIKPIPGKDRVECAVVNGWTIMVRKNQFVPGSIGIYFEIDSQVPARDPFMFLEGKHFKIKTQKYKIPDGQFWSQGLLMHPEDFSWKINGDTIIDNNGKSHRVDDESKFLTKELGVIYNVVEDNTRKSNSVDKYKAMAQRNGKLFARQPFRWLMKRSWGRKLLFAFFGKKKDRRTAWPEWVKKTDEERCLIGQTKIDTDQGKFPISQIVNYKLNVKVASMNNDGTISYKRILNYQKFDNDYQQVMTIGYPAKVDTYTRKNHICCTPDHRFWTQKGYIPANKLTLQDEIYRVEKTFSKDAVGALYGTLLGDGHISEDKRSNGRLRVYSTNGEEQLEYLKYKQSIFDGLGKIVNAEKGSFGKKDNYHWYLPVDGFVSKSIRQDLYFSGKKQITKEVLAKLNDCGLALWYMDDGNLSYRADSHHSPSVRLNTQEFSLEENNLIIEYFNLLGIDSKVRKDYENNGKCFYLIYITTEGTPIFLKRITPYMCKSMAYKTLPEFEGLLETKKPHYMQEDRAISVPILSINYGQKKNKAIPKSFKYVYDLEVEDNHNFIADGVIVHNCENMPWVLSDKSLWIATEKIDGSSTTFTMRRLKHGKMDFRVCSRNVVFDKPDKPCYYDNNIYLEMAEKYHIKEALMDILKKNPALEWVTLQGETYGKGVQKREYGYNDHHFAGFNFITSAEGRWNSVDAAEYMQKYDIPWVPILRDDYTLPDTIEELREYVHSEGSCIDGEIREGIVFRSQDGVKSFKCVDPEFLVKYHS